MANTSKKAIAEEKTDAAKHQVSRHPGNCGSGALE